MTKRIRAASTPLLLSVNQASDILGLSPWTIRQWAYSGRVASAKLGTRLMIPATELDRLIAENLRSAVQQ